MSSAQTWKRLSSPWGLCMTWGLHWTPSCENSYSQCICSFKSWLTHSFPDLWDPSKYDLEVPCGFQILLTLSLILCLFKLRISQHMAFHLSSFDSLMEPPIHHLTGTRLSNTFSYQGIPEPEFYITPLDQSCMIVLDTTGSPTTILDWLGIGQNLFLATIAARIQELTFCPDTAIISTTSKTSGLFPRYSKTCSTSQTPETPKSNPHWCSCIFSCKQDWRLGLFPTPDLTPEVTGHSTTTSETKVDMSTVPKDYHDFADIFCKSKAGKLADHWPYDLKITLDEGTSPPYGPIYSLSQEDLPLWVSSLTKTLLQVNPSSHSPHGALVLFIWKKTALFNIASTSKASTEFPRNTNTHFHSFLTS